MLIVSDPTVRYVFVLFIIRSHMFAKFFLSLRRIVVFMILFQVIYLIIDQLKLELNFLTFSVLLFLWRFLLLLIQKLIVMIFQFLIVFWKPFRKTMINDMA